MKQQLITMLELQDAMNTKVHPDWRERNLEWYRAIWVECAELMDHFGWKWWKKQVPDRDQVVLELVDIWHFGLSIVLVDSVSVTEAADKIAAALQTEPQCADFKLEVERFATITLTTKSFDVAAFACMMAGIDLSFEDLYRRYVGKNVLNFFRQDHGYKEGSYQKLWQGKEDNEHLVEVLGLIDSNAEDFKEAVYLALKGRYPVS